MKSVTEPTGEILIETRPPPPSPSPSLRSPSEVSLYVSVSHAEFWAPGNSLYSGHATGEGTVLLQGYSLSKVILMVLMAEGVSSSLQTHIRKGP